MPVDSVAFTAGYNVNDYSNVMAHETAIDYLIKLFVDPSFGVQDVVRLLSRPSLSSTS